MPTANVPKPPAPDAIRSWRRERDLSAASAAALVYTTARSWLRWEAGASPMPPALWELARLKRPPARRLISGHRRAHPAAAGHRIGHTYAAAWSFTWPSFRSSASSTLLTASFCAASRRARMPC